MHQRTLLPQMGRQNQQIKNFWKFETFGVLFYYCRKQSLKAKVLFYKAFLGIDEGQFFRDILEFSETMVNDAGKSVISLLMISNGFMASFVSVFSSLCIMIKGCVTTKKSLRFKDTLFIPLKSQKNGGFRPQKIVKKSWNFVHIQATQGNFYLTFVRKKF